MLGQPQTNHYHQNSYPLGANGPLKIAILGKGPKEKKCKNMVFDHNWGGGGQPEPYPYCKTPLFLRTLYTSSIILDL